MLYNVQDGQKSTFKSGTRIRSVAVSSMVMDIATYRHHPAYTTSSVQRGDQLAHCGSRFHKCFSVVGRSWEILTWYTAERIATTCVRRPWAKYTWNWASLCGILTNMASNVETVLVGYRWFWNLPFLQPLWSDFFMFQLSNRLIINSHSADSLLRLCWFGDNRIET